MNQCEQVIKYLDDFGSITPMDAFRDLGILRLSGRIYDLKEKGENIITEHETGKNRYGHTVRYARYRRVI